jgi:hypothetical protein
VQSADIAAVSAHHERSTFQIPRIAGEVHMAKAKSPNSTATSTNGDARTNGTVTVSKKKSTVSELQTSSAPDSNATNGNAPRSRSTDTSVYPSVSEEKIRQRAYELYMQRGGKHGSHSDDWYRAEAELRGRR